MYIVQLLYRVFVLSVPPDFQYQNQTTCQANEDLFYIEILLAKELWLAATCFFHFGSENWEEQVKNNPVYYISSCRVFRDREVEVQFFLCPLQTKLTSPGK